MQNGDSQQFQQGLGILTFKSLKWRNCPTTVRMELVIRISLGTVKHTHPFSSEGSPFHLVTISAERNPQEKWSGLL